MYRNIHVNVSVNSVVSLMRVSEIHTDLFVCNLMCKERLGNDPIQMCSSFSRVQYTIYNMLNDKICQDVCYHQQLEIKF